MSIAVALCAALAYGSADFFGGLASRRAAWYAVVLCSQGIGLLPLVVLLILRPAPFHAGDIPWAVASGFGGAIGIGALYSALAVGRMGVVSPITAVVGASIPVLVGLARGERHGSLAMLGIGAALVAVVLVSLDAERRTISLREPGVGLAFVSGLGIGALYVCLAHGSREGGLAVIAMTRGTSIAVLAAAALVMRAQAFRVPRAALGATTSAGLFDMSANVLYVAAVHRGELAIVAVITSLYPAATVILARCVLGERLGVLQWAGVAAAAVGVVCIALK